MYRCFLLVFTFLFITPIFSHASKPFPYQLIDKVIELKTLYDNKQDMPTSIPGIKIVSVEEAAKMSSKSNVVFLDNRVRTKYMAGKITNAVWFYSADFVEKPEKSDFLAKNNTYITYCASPKCWLSPAVALMLSSQGYSVYWMREGLKGWEEKGFILDKK